MKIVYLSVVLSSIVQICTAQLGYFGMRNAVILDGYFIPVYRINDFDSEYESRGLATTANFNVSRIISQKTALSLEYNYFKDFVTSGDDYGFPLVNYIRQNGIGVSFKRFRKSWIAPIGTYWVYSIFFCMNDVSEQKSFEQFVSWISVKYGVGFGYQKVVYDKILLDFGATIYLDTQELGNTPAISSARELAQSREFFRLKIGIGYLF